MAAVDFGTDVAGITSMGPRVTFVSGFLNLGMALCRRLITPRGSLLYDLNYGFDLRSYINAPSTPAIRFFAQNGVERECEKDPRVMRCAAKVDWSFATQAMPVSLDVYTAAGPFPLVLRVSDVTVQILNAGAL